METFRLAGFSMLIKLFALCVCAELFANRVRFIGYLFVAGFNRQKESKCDSFFWNNDSQLPREGVTETKVENWTRWAFTEHKDKAIITDFLKTLQACSRKAEFSDGIPIASICSGWGVC